MKTIIILMLAISSVSSWAAGKKAAKPTSELSTHVEFDPMNIHGRYQFAAEATARVENEKLLYDLLGPRKDFKDRVKKMSGQR